MRIGKFMAGVLAAAIFVAGAAGGVAAPALFEASARMTSAGAPSEARVEPGPIPLGTAPNFRAIVTQSGPAVVGITTQGDARASDASGARDFEYGPGGNSPFGDDPFSEFFRQLPIPHNNPHQRSIGSGFIVRPDGLILTNAHVVRDAERVIVKLADRREFEAKVLGVDPMTDIAVLKIDASNLPTVRVGNADQLEVGDYVLAIGQPYGFEASASAGIVSAKGRSLPGDAYVPFIQTDVAVNPGNSGGPLFDSSGAVVGINSQIYSNTGAYTGLSFAIPINVALQVQEQIVAHGKVEHARLGVVVQPLGQQLADSFELDDPSGALVAQVEPGSAAERAGIRSGDVILKFNGEPLVDAGDLSAKVGMARPGDTAKLHVWRDGELMTIEAELGSATQEVSAADNSGSLTDQGRLGLAVRPLTPQERDAAGVPGGLLVEGASGPAAEAGIQAGDVVLSVDGSPVNSVEELREKVGPRDKHVALLVQHGEARIFVPIELG